RATPNEDVGIVSLGAGKGTRLKSPLAKVLHPAGGRSLLEQVVLACAPLRARKVVAIVGHQADEVRKTIAAYDVESVLQQPQNGTGHALLVAKRALGNAKIALVVPGDAPRIRPETLKALLAT